MGEKITVGIVTTHPIQYQVPLFREIDARDGVEVAVFYGRIPDVQDQGKGFDTSFTWDIPLLQGYPWRVLEGQAERYGEREVETFGGFTEAYRDADVVLIHGWNTGYMRRAWWRGLREDVPLLVRGESNSMRSRPWYIRGLHRAYLSAFAACLYIGKSNRQFYRNAGVPSRALYSAPYCVENHRFDDDWKKQKGDRSALRSEWGINESAVCFLFCGKFIDKKRPTDVVKSFMQAWRRVDRPVHLLMVGDGALRSEAERLVPQEAPVTLTGFLNQTEIGKAYAAADVLVLPSDYGETWGLVVNEGMIFEMPAVVSDRVGCAPDLVHEGATGYKVEFGNVQALTSILSQMAEHPEHIRKMGKNARELVLSEYTIENAADGIVKAALDVYANQ
jgi:glycosyltransferase involved in cell wall biosynthesis